MNFCISLQVSRLGVKMKRPELSRVCVGRPISVVGTNSTG